jgi:DNA phosphorothioation-dependent restriction protein DptG
MLFIWSAITHFAIVDISPSVLEFFETEFSSICVMIGWFYIVALVMKLQRWSNRAKEKPPAVTEGK